VVAKATGPAWSRSRPRRPHVPGTEGPRRAVKGKSGRQGHSGQRRRRRATKRRPTARPGRKEGPKGTGQPSGKGHPNSARPRLPSGSSLNLFCTGRRLNIYIYVGVEVMCYVNRGVGLPVGATANNGGPAIFREAHRTLFLGCRLPRVLDRAATRQNSLPIRRLIVPLVVGCLRLAIAAAARVTSGAPRLPHRSDGRHRSSEVRWSAPREWR
jgi:hypothetical protein